MQRVEKLPEDEDLWRQLWLEGALVEQYVGDAGVPNSGYVLGEIRHLYAGCISDWRRDGELWARLTHKSHYWRIGLLVEE